VFVFSCVYSFAADVNDHYELTTNILVYRLLHSTSNWLFWHLDSFAVCLTGICILVLGRTVKDRLALMSII